MRAFRGYIILAWAFCIIVSVISLIRAIFLLVTLLPTSPLFSIAEEMVFTLLPMFFAFPATLIIARQPKNVIGWLLMILPLVAIPNDLMTSYLSTFRDAPPPATLPIFLMLLVTGFSWVAFILPILMIPLFFPTGRLLSPRWRWVIYLAVGMVLFLLFWGGFSRVIETTFADWQLINPIGFISEQASSRFFLPWSIMLAVLTIASLSSAVIRFRQADPIVREQMKWLLYVCVLFGLVYVPTLLLQTDGQPSPLLQFFLLIFTLVIIAFPVVITTAILRYRLFEIDVIIRLTVLYLILTALLGLVYLGGVFVLQQAFRAVTGQSANAAVVLTTLLIAALFAPLRRRLQSAIDRRFFRQKYNVDQALAKFAITTRSSTDLDSITSMLIDITQETLQPTQVRLYFRKRR